MCRDEIIAHAQRHLDLARATLADAEKFPTHIDAIVLSDKLVIYVRSFEELRATRHALRIAYGSWNDKLTAVWASANELVAAYQTKGRRIDIWWAVDSKNIPDEFPIADQCRIESRTETRTVLICPPGPLT